MTDDFQGINHCLFKGILVFFVLERELELEQFEACLKLLQEKSQQEVTPVQIKSYWRALEVRKQGKGRWDVVSPVVEPESSPDWRRQANLSQNNTQNIPQKRPYVGFSISGIKYVLDVWNPANELGIDYPGAGQPVVALVMAEEAYGNIFDRLQDNAAFYEIVRGIASICRARTVVGMNSGNLASLMRAYYEGNIARSTDPWSFLYPLQVTKLSKPVGDVALNRYFKKVEDWNDGRLLLQVKSGIDFTINQQNTDAAKLLGMIPVQNLNPDILKAR